MKKVNEAYFAEPVVAKMFSEDGKQLMVLLSDQTIFELNIGPGTDITSYNQE